MKFDDHLGLQPDLAEECHLDGSFKVATCTLRKNLKWSDGSPFSNRDFLSLYEKILDPSSLAPRADLLFNIKGAQELYQTKKGRLAILLKDDRTIRFELKSADPDFLYLLATLPLSPSKKNAFSGPYQLDQWEKGRRIILKKNPHYPTGYKNRPPVEMSFIEDEGTALHLYEKKQLDFLRRLPTLHLGKYKGSPDFHWIPLSRLDYIGFGPRLHDHPGLRQALVRSLNYVELQRLFHSEGQPGCPGIPAQWLAPPELPCHSFDPEKAKAQLAAQETKQLFPLYLAFSNAGGDDHRRAAEWEQDQWQKHLKIPVQVRGIENKIYLSKLKNDPPDLFRKAVTSDRPTCQSFLEAFFKDLQGTRLEIKNSTLPQTLQSIQSLTSEQARRQQCRQALSELINQAQFIPLGAIHYGVLARPHFKGWRLNSLGFLDLANLQKNP